jgi:hypothetical protein
MNAKKIAVALLGAMTIEGAICTAELVRIERNGVSMEVSVEDIEAPRAAFEQDLAEETE